jgi:hypothetical protein
MSKNIRSWQSKLNLLGIVLSIFGLLFVGGADWLTIILLIWFSYLFCKFLYQLILSILKSERDRDEFSKTVKESIKNAEDEIEDFGRTFLDGQSFGDYKLAHPSCFDGSKFKGCHNCGANSVWIKAVGNTKYGIHNQHICRTCGTALWRSNMTF